MKEMKISDNSMIDFVLFPHLKGCTLENFVIDPYDKEKKIKKTGNRKKKKGEKKQTR